MYKFNMHDITNFNEGFTLILIDYLHIMLYYLHRKLFFFNFSMLHHF